MAPITRAARLWPALGRLGIGAASSAKCAATFAAKFRHRQHANLVRSASRSTRHGAGVRLSHDRDFLPNWTPWRSYPQAASQEDDEDNYGRHNDDELPLCPEQVELVETIMRGGNVFYTGPAGSGKSAVLKAFRKRFEAKNKRVHVITPTGLSALNVGGSTIWSYAGWSPYSHKGTLLDLLTAPRAEAANDRFISTDVLVIDEISMVENSHFTRLSNVMKAARGSSEPFGGVQLVVTRDFHQLPPVKPFQYCVTCGKELAEIRSRFGRKYVCQDHGNFHDRDKWAFQSQTWEECNFVYFALKTIHRQSDRVFIGLLRKIRIGEALSESEIKLLMNHPCNTENATRLCPTRREAQWFNREIFRQLPTRKFTYQSFDDLSWEAKLHPHLGKVMQRSRDGFVPALDAYKLERVVELKEGMVVVLLTNQDLNSGLCNGSQGVICGFTPIDYASLQTVSEFIGSRRNRKDKAKEILVTLESDIHRKFTDGLKEKVLPIVKFHNGVTRLVIPVFFAHLFGDKRPYSFMCRTQIPLAPAWAMSVHRSQGMTLDRVVFDPSRVWEHGQAYVALSRARSLEGLKIEGSQRALRAVRGASPEVMEFHGKHFGM